MLVSVSVTVRLRRLWDMTGIVVCKEGGLLHNKRFICFSLQVHFYPENTTIRPMKQPLTVSLVGLLDGWIKESYGTDSKGQTT